MQYSTELVLRWTSLIKQKEDGIDAFWPSQIYSKEWLVRQVPIDVENIVIFGSWYGILADMLKEWNPFYKIICTDIDQNCVDWTSQYHESICTSMDAYTYTIPTSLVINTVTEHVVQEVYDEWFDNIPDKTYFLLQGNNDFNEKDHIRNAHTLEEFNKLNRADNISYTGELEYEGPWNMKENKPTYYKRFMTVGIKNDREDKSQGHNKD